MRISVLNSILLCLVFVLPQAGGTMPAKADQDYDVVVYGGTAAGVAAAVQAARMGKGVTIVCPDIHLGGLSSGGLGWTDTGNKAVIGGVAREFYHRVWLHYQKPDHPGTRDLSNGAHVLSGQRSSCPRGRADRDE